MQPEQTPPGHAIHRPSATFVDHALELEFRRMQLQAQRGFFMYIAALMLSLNIASLLFDAIQRPQALANPWVLGVRLGPPPPPPFGCWCSPSGAPSRRALAWCLSPLW